MPVKILVRRNFYRDSGTLMRLAAELEAMLVPVLNQYGLSAEGRNAVVILDRLQVPVMRPVLSFGRQIRKVRPDTPLSFEDSGVSSFGTELLEHQCGGTVFEHAPG